MLGFQPTDEQVALIEMAARFTRERIIPVAAECDRKGEFPHDVFKAGWELGLINPTVPAEYGGSGLGNLDRRARARSGSFELTPRDGGGTRALWSARLDGPGGSEA